MISRGNIETILELGVKAPSGDNSQPWRFEVKNDIIDIYNLPERDNPILNYEQRGSYVAHGALIENIIIAGTKFGYEVVAAPFPDPKRPTLTAHITLKAASLPMDTLADFISQRHTNRRVYEDAPLTSVELNGLKKSLDRLDASNKISFAFVSGPKQKKCLAEATSSIETVILEHKELHELLFHDIAWTKRSEQKTHSGLYLAAMEFAPPQKIVFWLASHWPIIKLLNALGLSRFIAREDAKLYATGSGFSALLLKNNRPEDFLLAGRAMQRLWLAATEFGLAFQPITALAFAAMRPEADLSHYFSAKHIKMIQSNYQTVQEILHPAGQTIAMLFRVGHAEPPSAFSSRKNPDINFL
jgi:nitroreductase